MMNALFFQIRHPFFFWRGKLKHHKAAGKHDNLIKGDVMGVLKREAGFTLIELMIVVAVIGILAGIAYPSYKEYIMKSRRSDAKSALMSLQMAQEKYRANCTQYATAIGNAYSCTAGNFTLIGSTTSPDGYYATSIVAANATTYSLRAARVAASLQNGDKCGDFQINQSGAKSVINAALGYDADRCW